MKTVYPFAGSCCHYDDPRRLLNHTEKYLLLDFMFGQNPSYFADYIDDVRYILSFSPSIRVKGDHLIDSLKIERNSWMCIHVRRTDFIERNISTDGISHFMIFGDDQKFMHNLTQVIIKEGKWKGNNKAIYQERGARYSDTAPFGKKTHRRLILSAAP
ncbi:hypothetical protein OSTOST_20743, partial [Ostertagia ostertagi]